MGSDRRYGAKLAPVAQGVRWGYSIDALGSWH